MWRMYGQYVVVFNWEWLSEWHLRIELEVNSNQPKLKLRQV